MRTGIRYYLPPAVYALFIFILSSIASVQLPETGLDWQDKLAHIAEYGILGCLLFRALIHRMNRCWLAFLTGLVLGTMYGGLDEIHQYFVPGRQCELGDFLADGAGIFTGQFVYWLAYRRR